MSGRDYEDVLVELVRLSNTGRNAVVQALKFSMLAEEDMKRRKGYRHSLSRRCPVSTAL